MIDELKKTLRGLGYLVLFLVAAVIIGAVCLGGIIGIAWLLQHNVKYFLGFLVGLAIVVFSRIAANIVEDF